MGAGALMPEAAPPVTEEVEWVNDDGTPIPSPSASIASVSVADTDMPATSSFLEFDRIFGPSRVNELDKPTSSDLSEESYVLKPLQPWTVVGLMIQPVKEANLLLPKRLDPFSRRGLDGTGNATQEEVEQAILEKRRAQMRLLNPGAIVRLDNNWHFQVQAGGSFRQGTTSATNINTQTRVERHSLASDFVARLGAFYSETQGGQDNRRVFGQANYDRNLRGRWLAYVRQDLEWDEIRLFNLREVTSFGIGFRFIDSVKERMVARLGPTASYIDYAAAARNVDEFKSGWLLELDYRRLIGESTRLEFTSTAFPDFDSEQQFRIRTEGALIFPIGRPKAWSWKLGLRHEYIMDPVITTQPNDVEGYFSIVYTR
jgi:hypothetical protein